MPDLSQTVQSLALSRVTRAAAKLGAAPTAPAPSSPRVSASRLYRAWEEAYRASGEKIVEEVSLGIALDELGLLGFAAMTAPTALDGLDAAARCYALVSSDGAWRVERGDERVNLVLDRPRTTRLGRRLSDEAAMAQFFACLRQAATVPPRVLALTTREPALAPRSLERLTGCRPSRGARDAIVLSTRTLDAPCVRAHSGMHAHFCALAAADAAQLAPRSWAERALAVVRQCIDADALSGAGVAEALGVSFRTLQRRLRDEGESFRSLSDRARCERAEELLRAGVSVDEVAQRVSYGERGAFHRAFRRWRGEAPGAFARRAVLEH